MPILPNAQKRLPQRIKMRSAGVAYPQSAKSIFPRGLRTKMRSLTLTCMIFGAFVGVYGDEERAAALRSSVFLEQPESTTVYESDTATFRCSVVNSSFSIFWLVNNSDAAFTVNRERGFSIVEDPDTHTVSRLEVAGHVFNNNTEVHCAAYQNHDDPLLTWIESEVVLLIVKATTDAPVVEQSTTEESPPLLLPTVTEVIQNSRVPGNSFTPKSTPASVHPNPEKDVLPKITPPNVQTLPKQGKTKKDEDKLVLFWYIGSVVGVLLLLVFGLLVLLLSRKLIRKGKQTARGKAGDKEEEDPELQTDHIYSTVPDLPGQITLQKNTVYEYVKPVKCQKNCAYDSVQLNSAASAHH